MKKEPIKLKFGVVVLIIIIVILSVFLAGIILGKNKVIVRDLLKTNSQPVTESNAEIAIGDVTGDQIINIADVVRLNRYVEKKDIELNKEEKSVADVNTDNIIDEIDVYILNAYVMGKVKKLPVKIQFGDVTGDNTISSADIVKVNRYVEKKNIELSEEEILAADVNMDNKIDQIDVEIINDYILGKITELPAQNSASKEQENIYGYFKGKNKKQNYELYLYDNGTFSYTKYTDMQQGVIGNYIINNENIYLNKMFSFGGDPVLVATEGELKLQIKSSDKITLNDNGTEITLEKTNSKKDQDSYEKYNVNYLLNNYSLENKKTVKTNEIKSVDYKEITKKLSGDDALKIFDIIKNNDETYTLKGLLYVVDTSKEPITEFDPRTYTGDFMQITVSGTTKCVYSLDSYNEKTSTVEEVFSKNLAFGDCFNFEFKNGKCIEVHEVVTGH